MAVVLDLAFDDQTIKRLEKMALYLPLVDVLFNRHARKKIPKGLFRSFVEDLDGRKEIGWRGARRVDKVSSAFETLPVKYHNVLKEEPPKVVYVIGVDPFVVIVQEG